MKFKLENDYLLLQPETDEEEKKLNNISDDELYKIISFNDKIKIKRGKKVIK